MKFVPDDSKSSTSSDDDVCPENRRNRTSFSPEQLDALEFAFRNNTYPDGSEREAIAKKTGLTEEKIMVNYRSQDNKGKNFRRGSRTGEPDVGSTFQCSPT